MVIDNLNVVRAVSLPDEADAILIVDADAVLARAIPFQSLQPIAGRNTEVIQRVGRFHLIELPERDGGESCESAACARKKQIGRLRIPEADNHEERV